MMLRLTLTPACQHHRAMRKPVSPTPPLEPQDPDVERMMGALADGRVHVDSSDASLVRDICQIDGADARPDGGVTLVDVSKRAATDVAKLLVARGLLPDVQVWPFKSRL